MFDDITTRTLTAAMHGANMRQAVLAQNLANADTPGYKRQDVEFESALAEAVRDDRDQIAAARRAGDSLPMARELSIAQVEPSITTESNTAVRVDGSNVDPDNEMSKLAANQLSYNTVTALLDARFGQMRMVIAGR